MLEVIEIDGKYYPLYDKEAWEASCHEEAIELAKEEGMKQGVSQGIEKGIEQGIEQGMEKGIYKVAKKLKNNDFSVDQIMKATGLTKEQINFL